MGGEEDDHIVALRLHELGQLIADALGECLDQKRMGAPPIDDAPLDVRGQVARSTNKLIIQAITF